MKGGRGLTIKTHELDDIAVFLKDRGKMWLIVFSHFVVVTVLWQEELGLRTRI